MNQGAIWSVKLYKVHCWYYYLDDTWIIDSLVPIISNIPHHWGWPISMSL